jgi:hypothetical protein
MRCATGTPAIGAHINAHTNAHIIFPRTSVTSEMTRTPFCQLRTSFCLTRTPFCLTRKSFCFDAQGTCLRAALHWAL